MDMAATSTETAIITSECGKMEKDKVMENWQIKMAKSMKESGKIVNLWDSERKIFNQFKKIEFLNELLKK